MSLKTFDNSNPLEPLPQNGGPAELDYALLDLLPTEILLQDENGIILYANENLCLNSGYTREELVGQHVRVFTPPGGNAAVQSDLAELRAGRRLEHEVENRLKDGTLRRVLLREAAIPLPNGAKAFLWIAEDITQHRLAESELRRAHDTLELRVEQRTAELKAANTALRESEQNLRLVNEERERQLAQLKAIFDNLTEGLIITDLAGRILHWNPAALRVRGITDKPGSQQLLTDYADIFELSTLDGNAVPIEQWPLSRILRGEVVRGCELHVRHREQGWRRVLSYSGTLARKPDGSPLLAVITTTDVTSRKQAEDKLVTSERRFRALTEKAAEDIVLLDAEGRIIYESPHEVPLLGFAPGEMMGRNCFELIFPEHLPLARQKFAEVLRTPRANVRGELRMRRKDGGWSWIHFYASNLLHDAAVGAVVLNLHNITERKEAEEALHQLNTTLEQQVATRTQSLRESEANFRSYFENVSIGAAQINAQGRFIRVNDRFCDITGYTREELLGGMGPLDLDHPGDREADRAGIANLLKGEGYKMEKRYLTKDGSVVWVRITVSPVLDAAGQFLRSAAVIEDITERKQAEEAMRLSEEKFARAFANNPAAIVLTRLDDGLFLDVNDTWVALSGFTRDEVIGRSARSMSIWPCKEAAMRFVGELRDKGVVRGWQQEFYKKSGEVYVAELSAQILTFDGEEVVLSTLLDITARKQAEQKLRESEEGYRTLFDLANEGILVLSEDGKVLSVNQSFAQMHGYNHDEILRLGLKGLDSPESARLAPARIRRLLANEPLTFEVQHYHKDGHLFPLEVSASRISSGERSYILALHRDITERKQAEAALKELNETLERRVAERLHAEQALRRQADLLDMASDAIIIREVDSTIQYWNRGAERLYGFSAEEARGQFSHELLQSSYPSGLEHVQINLAQHGVWTGEVTQTTKSGRKIIVETYQQLVEQPDGTSLVLVTNHDITERLLMHDAILAISERERQRLGQDLHDGLCQMLTAVRLKADALATRLAKGSPREHDAAKNLATLLAQSLDEARDLARGLEPVEPLPEGLMTALRHLAAATRELFGVACSCDIPRPVLVQDHTLATELFRIAQEAVTNAVKHSRAKLICIRLALEADLAVLTVTCNGKPFPKRPRATGMGLKTMRFRAGRIGAAFDIKRGPESGTVVRCALPSSEPGESNLPIAPSAGRQRPSLLRGQSSRARDRRRNKP